MLAVSYFRIFTRKLWEDEGGVDSEAHRPTLVHQTSYLIPHPPSFMQYVRSQLRGVGSEVKLEVYATPFPFISTWYTAMHHPKKKDRDKDTEDYEAQEVYVWHPLSTPPCVSHWMCMRRPKARNLTWMYLLFSHVWTHATHTHTHNDSTRVVDSTGRLSQENNHTLMSRSFPMLGGPSGPITTEENTTWQMAASWRHIKMKRANNACQRWN